MKFLVEKEIRAQDVATLERAMKSVDAEQRTVSVDSWLMAEEFIVAFVDEDFEDVRRIAEV